MYLDVARVGDSVIDIDVEAITRACELGLEEVARHAPKSGRPSDYALSQFLRAVIEAARSTGVSIKLPSDQIRGRYEARTTNPFFQFARECLKLGITKGKAAIGRTSLTESEKSGALVILNSYETKYTCKTRQSDGALLSQLRVARDAANAESDARSMIAT